MPCYASLFASLSCQGDWGIYTCISRCDELSLYIQVLACLERRVAAVTGLTALHDLDDIMVARTRPWDPSALPNHEELKTLLQQSANKEGSAKSLDTERNCAGELRLHQCK